MKDKKNLIIFLLIVIILLIVGGFVYFAMQNKTEDTESYNKAIKKYERIVRVAKKVNTKIDEEVDKVQKFIDTNPKVGKDKSTIEALEKETEKLEGLKIEILEKEEKLDELNKKIEKMEDQLRQVDENLLDKVEKAEAESGEGEEIEDIEKLIDGSSNIEILISNVEILTEEVEDAVEEEAERIAEEERKAKEEAERKAEEERKAKEEAEKKAAAEAQKKALANVVNGDFSYFAGTYVNYYNSSETLTLDKNGKVTIAGRVFTNKPKSVQKQSDGSYWCLTKPSDMIDDGFYIYPVGVAGGGTDSSNKVRVVICEAMGATPYVKK